MVFVVIMTIVGAITMFTLGAMFLLRYLNLGILLILLPGAILGWVAGSSVWSDWTKKFLNYTFFGPVAAFFVYIALKSAFIFKSSAETYFTNPVAGDAVLQDFAGDIGAMIMLVSLLLLGLKSAESMAEKLSVGGLKIANAAINGVLKGTAATSLGLGGFALNKATLGGFQKATDWASNVGKKSTNPLVRGFTRPIRQMVKGTKDFQQNYGGISGIFTGTTEGIAGGMGFNSRKARLKEIKEFETATKKERNKAEIQAKQQSLSSLKNELAKLEGDFKTASKGAGSVGVPGAIDALGRPISKTIDENKVKSLQEEINKKRQAIENVSKELRKKQNEIEAEESMEAITKAAKRVIEEEKEKEGGGEKKEPNKEEKKS